MDDAAKRVGLMRAAGRALLLRCPRCGSGRILDGWFKLKPNCSVCGLGLRRSPEDDEWFGGYFVNLCTSELLMIVVVMAYVAAKWPAVPWDTVWVLAVVMVIVSPIVSYPFSKALWVALEFVVADRPESRSRRRG
jgi:uncharacterized protein (DUF983 family)